MSAGHSLEARVISPPRPGRRERRRRETRERIFRAAARLFAEHGFAATTVEDITEAADVGKGTFFNYFPSKEHVLAVLAEIQRGKIAWAVKEMRHRREPVYLILRRLVHALAEEPGRSRALSRSLLSAMLSSEAVRGVINENVVRAQKLVAEIITTGQERGEVRRDRSPLQLAVLLQRAAFGTIVLWSLSEEENLDRWLDATFRTVWDGIRTPGTRSKRAKEAKG